eukprot:TRINITY_DN1743_c0_g2_i2.p2 TRINITY_DN1743_c0_g2~~TRINITY_DN1743_c0_g2_i2.p2  ORF type:complete len:359 (+),score=64.00 TRINITY_DN1743_c0_g2_i2:317-1393(+)
MFRFCTVNLHAVGHLLGIVLSVSRSGLTIGRESPPSMPTHQEQVRTDWVCLGVLQVAVVDGMLFNAQFSDDEEDWGAWTRAGTVAIMAPLAVVWGWYTMPLGESRPAWAARACLSAAALHVLWQASHGPVFEELREYHLTQDPPAEAAPLLDCGPGSAGAMPALRGDAPYVYLTAPYAEYAWRVDAARNASREQNGWVYAAAPIVCAAADGAAAPAAAAPKMYAFCIEKAPLTPSGCRWEAGGDEGGPAPRAVTLRSLAASPIERWDKAALPPTPHLPPPPAPSGFWGWFQDPPPPECCYYEFGGNDPDGVRDFLAAVPEARRAALWAAAALWLCLSLPVVAAYEIHRWLTRRRDRHW